MLIIIILITIDCLGVFLKCVEMRLVPEVEIEAEAESDTESTDIEAETERLFRLLSSCLLCSLFVCSVLVSFCLCSA